MNYLICPVFIYNVFMPQCMMKEKKKFKHIQIFHHTFKTLIQYCNCRYNVDTITYSIKNN